MNIKSLYITSNDTLSGKLLLSIGLMQLLKSRFQKVAFFKPIIQSKTKKDNDIEFILKHFNLMQPYDKAYGLHSDEVETLVSKNDTQYIYETLLKKIKKLEESYDFIVIEGIEPSTLQAMDEFDLNLKIAKHLNSSILCIINGYEKNQKQILESIKIEHYHLKQSGVNHLLTLVNRVEQKQIEPLNDKIKQLKSKKQVVFFPHIDQLNFCTVAQIKKELKLKKVFATKLDMQKSVYQTKVAAMRLENLLKYIETNDLLIVPADRTDLILGILPSIFSKNTPNISAILLTGDIKLHPQIYKVLKGLDKLRIPILRTDENTYDAAIKVSQIKPKIMTKDTHKITLVKGLFQQYFDEKIFDKRLQSVQNDIITPIMFEYSLFQKVKRAKKTIVLPESFDQRVLEATQTLLNTKLVDIILIGDKDHIRHKAKILGYDITNATIIDPKKSEKTQILANELFKIRWDKGLTREKALEVMQTDETYFATMLVYLGYAHGMVSGAVNTTANTVRPALQIIKTKGDISIVSSVFFMCLDTKVLLFSDCAIVQDPTALQLAHIAISTASSAKEFGIDPNIAMLSYSTGTSGQGEDVDKIKEATNLVKQIDPSLKIEGPIQYDAATSKTIAKQKLPQSQIAGEANILIFPDLNTGNNTYKAVRSSANAVAIGPILQGLKKPVNDLSRGCDVRDIINTVVITAIQANSSNEKI